MPAPPISQSYNRAAEVLKGHTFADEEQKARAKQLALDCRCNAAVCAWKNEEMGDVKVSATKVSGPILRIRVPQKVGKAGGL
jgi:cytochrome c-type biogenesis protein CcmH/NrfF